MQPVYSDPADELGLAQSHAKKVLADKRSAQIRVVREWVIVTLVAVTAAFLFRTLVFQQYYIDGPSMLTTLHPQDRVFVNKLSYKLHDIHRGDVIVFDRLSSQIEHDDLIKRVIGLAGETLEIRSCVVFIDGVPLDEPYLNLDQMAQSQSISRCGTRSDVGAQIIPEDTVFVMGDNRAESFDSREFGAIESSQIRGRAFVIIWPVSAWAWL